jgi:hypothetical protein
MTVIQWILIAFVVLEIMNVLTLYFAPASKKGNGMGVFNAWLNKDDHPESAHLLEYLVNWVAGVKLIFIGLVILIVVRGDAVMHQFTALILLITTLTFYWRLYPKIRLLDRLNALSVKGYAQVLAVMIFVFCLAFTVAWITALTAVV